MTKEEILNKMKSEMPFVFSENMKPYIKEAMDIYAKQEVVDFVKWADKNKWFYRDGSLWWNFGIVVESQVELTTAQLYDKYKSTQ